MAFGALVTFTCVLFLAPQAIFPVLAPLRIAFLSAGAAAAAHLWAGPKISSPMAKRLVPVAAALAAWSLLTAPFSFWPGGSVSFLLSNFSKSLIAFWLIAGAVNTVSRLRLIFWILTLIALPLAWTGISQFSEASSMGADELWRKRLAGYEAPLTANPNDLALTLNLILPLTLALIGIEARKLRKAMLLGLALMVVIAIFLTYSRAGFVTLATVMIAVGVKLSRRSGLQWAALFVLIALCVVPFVSPDYLDRVSTIVNIEADATGSAQARWHAMSTTVEIIAERPLTGVGLGMNIIALNEKLGPVWNPVHNVFLEYAGDLGIPGLALFLYLLWGVFRCARIARDTSPRTDLASLADGAHTAMIAFVVGAMFHPVGYHFYFYYFGGLALAAEKIAGSLRSRTRAESGE